MKCGKAGFTLTEVLVAMSIFSITALATGKLMLGSTQAVSQNAESTRAIALAQKKLEDLRNMRYDALVSGSEATPASDWKGKSFTVAWIVNRDTPIVNASTVTVTVSWTSHGQTRTYATRSIYSQVTAE
jgi:type II secretion system protein I